MIDDIPTKTQIAQRRSIDIWRTSTRRMRTSKGPKNWILIGEHVQDTYRSIKGTFIGHSKSRTYSMDIQEMSIGSEKEVK